MLLCTTSCRIMSVARVTLQSFPTAFLVLLTLCFQGNLLEFLVIINSRIHFKNMLNDSTEQLSNELNISF
jgi:hypothetical protein